MASSSLDDIPKSHRSPVVVVSASRSGSTLLQRALNVHPKLTVWGEHFGILGPLAQSLQMLNRNAKNLDRGHDESTALIAGGPDAAARIKSPHVNPFELDGYADRLRTFVHELLAGDLADDVHWGFKEIHYRRVNLIALRALFPDTRFIVLAREPRAQVSSMIRARWQPYLDSSEAESRRRLEQQVAKLADDWHTMYASFHRFASEHPDSVLDLRYDDLAPAAFPTRRVFDHIGLAPPPADHLALAFETRIGSSDASARWTDADRAAIEEIFAAHRFPAGHDELVEHYVG